MTGARRPDDLPTIAIERTAANDVYLVLSGLGMGREAERVLSDPVAFLHHHRAEVRLATRWLEGRLAGAAPATEPTGSTGPESPAPPAERARSGPRRPTPAEELRRAPSLLR